MCAAVRAAGWLMPIDRLDRLSHQSIRRLECCLVALPAPASPPQAIPSSDPTPRTSNKQTNNQTNKQYLAKKVKLAREVIRDVVGLMPYEKRILDVLKTGGAASEKKVYKFAKRRVRASPALPGLTGLVFVV